MGPTGNVEADSMTDEGCTLANDSVTEALALMELTDANVSPALDGAWDTAVADVRHEAEEATATYESGFDTMVDMAISFG